MAKVKGPLQFRQKWDGTDTILAKYSQTWRYPVTGSSSGLLDGIYALEEYNDPDDFPDLA